jgi:hypothetical protein
MDVNHGLKIFWGSNVRTLRVWNAILRSLWNAHIAARRGFPHGLYILHPWLQTLKLTIISHFNNGRHGLVEFQSPAFAPDVCPAYNLPARPCRIVGEKYLLTIEGLCDHTRRKNTFTLTSKSVLHLKFALEAWKDYLIDSLFQYHERIRWYT